MVVSKVGVVDVKIPIKPGVKKVTEQENSFSNQILILFSVPLLNEDLSPVENLAIQEEINAIASVLKNISHPISVEIVVKVATSQTLQDVLSNRSKPLIIHFIGHGMKEGNNTALVLEDEVGMTRSFTEEELEIALSNRQQVPCQVALLNACHSEKLAQAFVKAGVFHVVAVNAEDKILDVAARCFSRRFYQALFNQDSVTNSFLSGRNAVKLDDKLKKLFNSLTFEQGVNFDEAFKYELLPKGSPHNQSLIIEPATSHQVLYPHWSNTNIPREDKNFVGRRKEIHQVIKALVESDKRCIALHGMGGIGKTALAYAIGRWLHERDRYQDGVWFISLRDTDSVGTLITKVKQSLELKSFALERELRNSRIF
ncbi:MAG: CHAT domain-containing protein [Methylacidiphilales bacterium]|nr:CHAT domain-containing protein [Candidatus Methylacidiphilales bacterium]